jgi:FkbM family methyltransferase
LRLPFPPRLPTVVFRKSAERVDAGKSGMKLLSAQGLRFWYREGTSDEAVVRQILEDQIYSEGMPEYVPGPGHVIIDVGAHIGAYSIFVAPAVGAGRVFALEPCGETYELLARNVLENALTNVLACRVALTDQPGQTTLWYDQEKGNWGHSVVRRLSDHGETVPTETLERFLLAHGIDDCALAKFNCEGAEFPILLSTSIEALRRIERLLILYHMDIAEGSHYQSLVRHLRKAGYYVERRFVTRNGQRGWLIAIRASFPERIALRTRFCARTLRSFLLRLYAAAYWAKQGMVARLSRRPRH